MGDLFVDVDLYDEFVAPGTPLVAPTPRKDVRAQPKWQLETPSVACKRSGDGSTEQLHKAPRVESQGIHLRACRDRAALQPPAAIRTLQNSAAAGQARAEAAQCPKDEWS